MSQDDVRRLDSLIVIATPNVCWLRPDAWYPKSAEEIAEQAIACVEAEASIVYAHAEERWKEAIGSVRKRKQSYEPT